MCRAQKPVAIFMKPVNVLTIKAFGSTLTCNCPEKYVNNRKSGPYSGNDKSKHTQ